MITVSAVCSTTFESDSICSRSCLAFVTSRNTATAPRNRPSRPRTGALLTLSHRPPGTAPLRTNSSASTTVSPRSARTSGSRSAGQGVTVSGRKKPYADASPDAGTPGCRAPSIRSAAGLNSRKAPSGPATITPSARLVMASRKNVNGRDEGFSVIGHFPRACASARPADILPQSRPSQPQRGPTY